MERSIANYSQEGLHQTSLVFFFDRVFLPGASVSVSVLFSSPSSAACTGLSPLIVGIMLITGEAAAASISRKLRACAGELYVFIVIPYK